MLKDTKEVANRFLGWKLPKDFNPDCGISFDKNTSHLAQIYLQQRKPKKWLGLF